MIKGRNSQSSEPVVGITLAKSCVSSLDSEPLYARMNSSQQLSKLSQVVQTLEIGDEFFQEPRRLARPGPWAGHLPAAFWLIKAVRPQILVELGTHSGNSYSAFCQTIGLLGLPTRAFAVDTWQGDEHAGFYDESVFQDFNAFNQSQFSSFSKLLRMTFDEARDSFADGSIDLLHIDGLHTYEAVRHDFENWRSAASDRAVVVFHDTNVRERGFGVWKLWKELSEAYSSFEFHHSEGLGVLGLGEKQSHLMTSLFELGKDPETAALVRQLFAARGETFLSRVEGVEWKHQVSLLSADNGSKAARMAALEEEISRRDDARRILEQELSKRDEIILERQREAGLRDEFIQKKEHEIQQKDAYIAEREQVIRLTDDLIHERERVVQGLESLLREREQKLQQTAESLHQREQQIADLEQANTASRQQLATVQGMLQVERSTQAQLITTLNSRIAELSESQNSLRQELDNTRTESLRVRGELEQIQGSRTWRYTEPLRRVKRRLFALPVVRSQQVSPLEADREMVAASGLFDLAWYVNHNPDVVSAGVDPLTHYLEFGGAELRDPGPRFSSKKYLEQHSDVRAAGMNPLVHFVRYGIAEGRQAFASADQEAVHVSTGAADVFSYMSTPIDPSALPKRVAIGVSSLGNFFMAEIAYMLENAFRNLGVATRLFAEHEASDVADYETVVVVAPHEFFLLGQGPAALEVFKQSPRLVMFNVEQRQTQWFRVAEQYLPHASAILDISYQSACHLRRAGHKSFFLPLGYSEYIERTFEGRELPDHEIFKYMSAPLRNYLPATYADRPIDILFIGASTPRRKAFFSKHASYFADKNCFIYLPDTNRPFLATESRTIGFATFVSLLKRSKLLLNVHQDDEPFFEWQRIVNLGLMQRTLVISERCETVPCIEANIDYLDGALATLPALCEFALNNLQEAESIADRAYTKLKTKYPMEQILAKCWTDLVRPLG